MGLDARILTRRWEGDRIINEVPVLVTADSESPARKRAYDVVERLMWQVESPLARFQRARYLAAMGSETTYRPYISAWVADAFGISRVVREMRPQFICGQEVFAYGLATAFSRGTPRVLMPWGGDVYMYADTTTMASAAVRFALTHVDLVAAGSPLARDYLHKRFGVDEARMHVGGTWALDRERFSLKSDIERVRVRARLGIAAGALVIMNVRRFYPAWGSDLAFNSFVRFAKEHSSSHFILLGGQGTEPFVAAARATLERERLSDRFTLFDGEVQLEECAACMSVADIVVSLMREQDMRPLSSILEASACGGAPILGDQAEYRAMERLGFRALFCPAEDHEKILGCIREYAGSERLRAETALQNQRYLDEHEDGRQQAIALLRRIRSIRDAYDGRLDDSCRDPAVSASDVR